MGGLGVGGRLEGTFRGLCSVEWWSRLTEGWSAGRDDHLHLMGVKSGGQPGAGGKGRRIRASRNCLPPGIWMKKDEQTTARRKWGAFTSCLVPLEGVWVAMQYVYPCKLLRG